jgi:hypothetical protein
MMLEVFLTNFSIFTHKVLPCICLEEFTFMVVLGGCAELTVSAIAVQCTQPGLRALLLASQTGTHGVWN